MTNRRRSVSELVLNVIQQALVHTLLLSGPVVAAALVVGLIVSLFQATTQIQDQTLSAAPKMVVVYLIIFAFGGSAIEVMRRFAHELFDTIRYVG